VKVRRCTACGRLAFPPRLWCPDCGRADWDEVEVESGVVETATTTRDGARLATVVLDGGPPILLGVDADDGDRIDL
jgi:hypothetical protein